MLFRSPAGIAAVVEQVLVPPTEMYLVNQGPVFSGPGHALARQAPDLPDVQPGGYPYGLQNSGGYARGYYDPAIGYPYAEPMPRRAGRRSAELAALEDSLRETLATRVRLIGSDRAGRRSEERRVGKECRPLCRSRWSPYH